MQTEALFIDGMGTLVSLASPISRLVAGLAAHTGVTVSEGQARRALEAEIAYYRDHMQQGRDARSLAGLHARCAEVLRGALPASVATVDPGAMTELLLAVLHFEPYGDARALLGRVRAAGARVIVVSNWDVSLIDVLERVGLAPLLDGVVASAAVGARKPDRAIFDAALAMAGVGPAGVVHVGDSVAQDVAGAQAAGIAAVLLDRSGARGRAAPTPAPPGVPVIAGLDELDWPPGA